MGILTILALSPLAANFVESGSSNFVFLAGFVIVVLIVFLAPTGRRAWGRGSLVVGVIFLAMPLFVLALSTQVGTTMVQEASTADESAAAIGATIGGGLMVGASAFVGFILGGIFVILGLVLVLGGRREVIVVEKK